MEINLLINYPITKRDLKKASIERTENERLIARKFDKNFFDGDRKFGYGGFNYDPKYWNKVVVDFVNHYNLKNNSSILDIGCGKGFMLYDFFMLNPSFRIAGLDISEYAIKNSKPEITKYLTIGSADNLPYENKSFDLVISINTIHNLEKYDCAKAIREIERVSKKNKFIIVDAYKNVEEKKRMFQWNLTAKTIMHRNEWIKFFKENKYTGDYYWFTP
jgi:ubiquinone/menaquinone biosynthesis C-methylase UbiE